MAHGDELSSTVHDGLSLHSRVGVEWDTALPKALPRLACLREGTVLAFEAILTASEALTASTETNESVVTVTSTASAAFEALTASAGHATSAEFAASTKPAALAASVASTAIAKT